MFWVYVLKNPQGRIYIGQTDSLDQRLLQHNTPDNLLSKYTKRYPGPWRLVHQETFPSRSQALLRERALKSGQGRAWLHREILGKK
jgi:putative endonuclease